jgi:hypothetical protein
MASFGLAKIVVDRRRFPRSLADAARPAFEPVSSRSFKKSNLTRRVIATYKKGRAPVPGLRIFKLVAGVRFEPTTFGL